MKSEQIRLVKEWLSQYTEEVVIKVMKNFDKIVNDETTIKILKLLAEQKEEHNKDREWIINVLEQDKTFYDKNKPYINKDYIGTQTVLYYLYIKD